MDDGFDELYASSAAYFGPGPSELLTAHVARIRAGGRVLDIGAGQGRHALPLAARGIEVVALDPSAEALAQTRQHAEERGLRIHLRQGRIADFVPSAPFDAILMFGLIQILPRSEVEELLRERLAAWAAPGCVLMMTGWHVDDPSHEQVRESWTPIGPKGPRRNNSCIRPPIHPA